MLMETTGTDDSILTNIRDITNSTGIVGPEHQAAVSQEGSRRFYQRDNSGVYFQDYGGTIFSNGSVSLDPDGFTVHLSTHDGLGRHLFYLAFVEAAPTGETHEAEADLTLTSTVPSLDLDRIRTSTVEAVTSSSTDITSSRVRLSTASLGSILTAEIIPDLDTEAVLPITSTLMAEAEVIEPVPWMRTKVGTLTVPNANVQQVVTGIGFTPKALILHSAGKAGTQATRPNGYWSMGFATGPDEQGSTSFWAGKPNNTDGSSRASDSLIMMNGFAYGASLTSLDEDGFTLTWSGITADELPAGTDVRFIALGGSIDAYTGYLDSKTATEISDVPFEPNLVLFSMDNGNRGHGFGVATAESQWSHAWYIHHANDSNFASRHFDSSHALSAVSSDQLQGQGKVEDFTETGFTLSWSTRWVQDMGIPYLALWVPEYDVGVFDMQTGTGTQTVNVGKEPQAAIFGTAHAPDGTPEREMSTSTAITEGETQFGSTITSDIKYYSSPDARQSDTASILIHDPLNTNSRSDASVSFTGNGFELDWEQNDLASRPIGYLLLTTGGLPRGEVWEPYWIRLRSYLTVPHIIGGRVEDASSDLQATTVFSIDGGLVQVGSADLATTSVLSVEAEMISGSRHADLIANANLAISIERVRISDVAFDATATMTVEPHKAASLGMAAVIRSDVIAIPSLVRESTSALNASASLHVEEVDKVRNALVPFDMHATTMIEAARTRGVDTSFTITSLVVGHGHLDASAGVQVHTRLTQSATPHRVRFNHATTVIHSHVTVDTSRVRFGSLLVIWDTALDLTATLVAAGSLDTAMTSEVFADGDATFAGDAAVTGSADLYAHPTPILLVTYNDAYGRAGARLPRTSEHPLPSSRVRKLPRSS